MSHYFIEDEKLEHHLEEFTYYFGSRRFRFQSAAGTFSPGHVDLFGNHYWELRSPYREGKPPLNTGPAPREPIHRSLSEILESDPDAGYYLSGRACRGILRRAKERGKELPHQLKAALNSSSRT